LRGLPLDRDYPYTDREDICSNPQALITPPNFTVISPGNNDMLLSALHQTPVAVSLDATHLQFYNSGIYNGPCSNTRITHFMTVIGYGTDAK
jgi:hypothetical protein